MPRPIAYFLIFAVLSAAVLGITGCGKNVKVSDDAVIATWGDTSMTVAQFKDKMIVRNRNEATAMKAPLSERESIINEYIMRDCKILEGKRLGIDKREDVQKQLQESIKERASTVLYDREIEKSMFTDEQIRNFWEHDQEERRARHILIKLPEKPSPADTMKAWKRINEVQTKVKAGEDFVKLVDEYNEDDTVDKKFHGDLGFFKWGRMVDEFQEAAWKLKPGEISNIVRTRYGYHIIQLLEVRPKDLEFHISQILVKSARRASSAETTLAYERAKMIYEKASKPSADFVQLARAYSEDKDSWENGDLGWLTRGSMPSDVWDAVTTMKKGEIRGPINSYKGYHVIKLHDSRSSGKPLTDPEERDAIIASLARVHREQVRQRAEFYLDSVKNAFEMKYNNKTIALMKKKLSDKSIPTNMSIFSSFTPEERELLVVSDKLGGLKIQELVDRYGDHRIPVTYREDDRFIPELVEPILLPKYLDTIAREKGLVNDPKVMEDVNRDLENAILPEIEREMVYNKATPTEDEIKSYYDSHPDEYKKPAQATIYEIMVTDKAAAENYANQVRKGEDISKLARRNTTRAEAKRKGGKLGPFTVDQYGAVSREAFKLQPGQVAGPIKDGDNYSVIALIEKTPEQTTSFAEARTEIESKLRLEKQNKLKKDWEAEIARVYKIKVDEKILRNVWPLVDPLPESMVAERKDWQKDREKQAKQIIAENQIKLKVTPGKTQEFTTKEGKQVKVQFGEPRYVDKDGKETEKSKSSLKVTPKKSEPVSKGK